jgi:acyl-CoA thioesterase-2
VSDLWDDLLGCLELTPGPTGSGYEGRNQHVSYHRLFGGQLLGQFVRAASLACPDKAVKSLHVLFARAGRTGEPVRYQVQTHHHGATFATLELIARQNQGVLATASVSMHSAEDGPDRQTVPDVTPLPGPEHRVVLDLLPFETRWLADLDSPAARPPELDLWLRTPPVSAELATALLAYATDLTLIGVALGPVHGVSQLDAGTAFASAVTSHTIWFHRPLRTDDWLLLRQHSPIVAHSRCFGRGDVLTEAGVLVASYAQEALLRFKSSPGV